jgi:SAM-dependent methyltransferase
VKTRYYDEYEEYLKFQSIKTLDPAKRKKWLGEEWRLKIDGFKKEFSKLGNLLKKDFKCLCIGARTGQEVVALKEMGIENVIGIDIVEHAPHVIKGDMHNLDFSENEFDFIYTNILDHSIYPDKLFSEVEKALKIGGLFYLQIQFGLDQDEYTEYVVENPFHDVVTLAKKSYCLGVNQFERNFAGMNLEYLFQKDEKLTHLFERYGDFKDIIVPETYAKLWNDINLPIQNNKLDQNGINSTKKRNKILATLRKRAYYLTRIAEIHEVKNIAEVGTAEGWQYFSFAEYCKTSKDGCVFSCDPRDVRSNNFKDEYKDYTNFMQGTSKEMCEEIGEKIIDLFYIDGLHDKDTVIQDVFNLQDAQSSEINPIWIFDDFDERFGCFDDIANLCMTSRKFKIWKVGLTASGKPSHQAMTVCRYLSNES